MRVMFDINVVLDIVGSRKPFYADSRSAFLRVIESGDEPCLAIHAYPSHPSSIRRLACLTLSHKM